MSSLQAKKSRGQYKGMTLLPHKHQDGCYVASISRFEIDYIRVETEDELKILVRSGYGVRMSNTEIPQAPSFISCDKIIFSDDIEAEKTNPITVLTSMLQEEDLDIDSITKSRKEQTLLRGHLCKQAKNAKCVICQKDYPIQLLVAAHIKKRSDCDDSEKLDFDNIASLMCKLGCDDLFEKGYITVDKGTVVKNKKRDTTPHLDDAISSVIGNNVTNWGGSQKYYEYHASKFNK